MMEEYLWFSHASLQMNYYLFFFPASYNGLYLPYCRFHWLKFEPGYRDFILMLPSFRLVTTALAADKSNATGTT